MDNETYIDYRVITNDVTCKIEVLVRRRFLWWTRESWCPVGHVLGDDRIYDQQYNNVNDALEDIDLFKKLDAGFRVVDNG